MRTPTAAVLLDAWENALDKPPTARALGLLATAFPELSGHELAALPIGRRDARLLRLRERLFGPHLTLVVPCPECGAQLESRVRVGDIARDGGGHGTGDHIAESHGYRIRFRLPASSDLLALPAAADASRARELLLAQCVLEVHGADGGSRSVTELPESVLAEVSATMASIDPGADIELVFDCPACSHQWREVLDVAGFVWREIHAWAQRILREIHLLARAYGWREADVLALSPTRRQIYLELCRQ